MKKEFTYNQVSTKTCKDCGRPLKKNLLNQHKDAEHCWVCWRIATGRPISRGKDLRKKQEKNRHKYGFDK